ncbi:Orc1/Cdc6 family replication initiation protein [Candidatus Mancarchaeum acidiphilum]|uniref:ORC1-type DNA replication protein n=1 Tax=Candidatus Mancarchaeum acidiphilum TaxID=1920749 RepID=A0A218NLQ5_9ARCH|nr:AAA family ATPase [Candidatus Mancarchaeum acidiphilum]ASI13388.1 Orc1/Cdc6 family replication initiation protein [Candidatus Mancarchaeum acidiphilum]
MQTLNDLLAESKIFQNREVLSPHYIPKKLIFREKEINDIEKAIAPSLKGEKGRNLFIYGKTGTGKTTCTKYVINEISTLPNIKTKISYINCRIYNSRYRVLNKIVSDHLPNYAKRGFGTVDLYEKLINWMEEDTKVLVIALDEIDMVKDLDDLIYTLTRINSDIRFGGVSIIGISNNVSFKDDLDPRSLSALYESELVFPSYYANELYAIIKDRVIEGFKENAISDEVLHYIAAAAAKEGGDARFSLNVLSEAGEYAELNNEDSVKMADAEKAIQKAGEDAVYELISTLPYDQKLVLYSIVLIAESGGSYKKLSDGIDTYIFSGEIYSRYKSLAEGLHKTFKSERWYRNYISELETYGLISSFESGKGIRGHTKLIKLIYPSKKIKKVIESDLFSVSDPKSPDEK